MLTAGGSVGWGVMSGAVGANGVAGDGFDGYAVVIVRDFDPSGVCAYENGLLRGAPLIC